MAALLIRIGGIPRMTEEILLVFFKVLLGKATQIEQRFSHCKVSDCLKIFSGPLHMNQIPNAVR